MAFMPVLPFTLFPIEAPQPGEKFAFARRSSPRNLQTVPLKTQTIWASLPKILPGCSPCTLQLESRPPRRISLFPGNAHSRDSQRKNSKAVIHLKHSTESIKKHPMIEDPRLFLFLYSILDLERRVVYNLLHPPKQLLAVDP